MRFVALGLALLLIPLTARAETRITFDEALAIAKQSAPDVDIARSRARATEPLVRMAGLYPNPQLLLGSASDSAVFSAGIQFPLPILGQLGAGVDAMKALRATAEKDTDVAINDARLAVARAYIGLWLAVGLAGIRHDATTIATSLEKSVVARVETGAAPEIDALRLRSERLRADADASMADAQTVAAAVELGRLLGRADGSDLRPNGDPSAPSTPPAIDAYLARIDASPNVQREEADARASEARAQWERALARPNMQLLLQAGMRMPTDAPNAPYPAIFRLVFQIDLPIFNWRGANVDRELALADAARSRSSAARLQRTAQLRASYQVFDAATARVKVLSEVVIPTAEDAQKAVEGAYSLGRSTLIAVLDAQRAVIDARAQLLAAKAERWSAWALVMHAVGYEA